MLRARATVGVLLGALAVYFVLIGIRGVFLLGEPRWSLKALGVAVLALPLVGLWVVIAEVRFGRAAQRLTDELGSVGAEPPVHDRADPPARELAEPPAREPAGPPGDRRPDRPAVPIADAPASDAAGLLRRPSGRIDRAAADALFARQRAEVQADPGDWRRWYRLAEAYDLAGDRRRAREAMRTAIERHDVQTS